MASEFSFSAASGRLAAVSRSGCVGRLTPLILSGMKSGLNRYNSAIAKSVLSKSIYLMVYFRQAKLER